MSERETVKKKIDRVDVQRAVLGVIGAAGLITLALMAPNAIQILRLFKGTNDRYRSPRYVSGIVGKLQKKNWVRFKQRNGQSFLCLTEKGERELLRYQLKEKTLKKKKWDGKWRVVAFDVKEFKRNTRDKIRRDIISFGFVRLQDSVWVYPYDCEEIVALLKAHCHIGKEVLYLIVEKIENDNWLKKKFSLDSKE